MEDLMAMLEDNEKAMSILVENMNDMKVAEFRYKFEGKEYVFKASEAEKHKENKNNYKRRRNFICHSCQSYFSDNQYRPLCDKCKEKK